MSKSPPPFHATDKLKLTELCLHSFKGALGNLRVRMFAVLDKCPPDYEELFNLLWSAEDLKILRYPGIGNHATFAEQVRLLTEQTDAELVYLAEDDYVYRPGEFVEAVDFLRKNSDVDFVSPYNHPDRHSTELHRGTTQSRSQGERRWETAMSTTCSFMGRRETLQRSSRAFLAYGRGCGDLGMWMAVTKRHVFNPFKVLRWLVPHKFWAGSILYAWRYAWRQILFGRRYSLWVPQPSIATHMVAGLEAPGIDWQKEFREQQARIPRA